MSSFRLLRRKAASWAFVAFCVLAVAAALAPLGFILFFVLSRGLSSVDLAFFTQLPKPVGEAGGGMANAIVGTLILIGMAGLLGVPVGVLSGIYLSEYRTTPLASAVRFCADVLNGVPSIV